MLTSFARSARLAQPALSARAASPVVRSAVASAPARRFAAAAAAGEDDVVVIGGGPGGYVAAIKAGQLGFNVTCVEGRGSLGGTCLNVGCIPSKALLHASHLYHQTGHDLSKYGIKTGKVEVDLGAMMKQKEKSVKGLTTGIEGLFKKNKVKYEKGWGSITGKNEVTVALADGTTKLLRTKNIVIATGSDHVDLPFMPADEKRIVSSTGALSLSSIPKTMVVVGGGVIGLEMGSVWSRLGAEVTVVEFTNQICAGADQEIAKGVLKMMTRQGLKFQLGRKVVACDSSNPSKIVLTTEAAAGGDPQKIECEVCLVSVGRRPNTKQLNLQKLGIKTDKAGRVEINDHFETNVPGVYAIGDVVRGAMLAHKAEEEGIAVVESLRTPGVGHVNYHAIPSVVYTEPEVAWVGYTEEECKAKGLEYVVGKFPFMANSRARTMDTATPEAVVKIIAEKKTDKILGAHIIGPSAGDLIQELVLAIEYNASSEDIARTSHAHPTLSEALKEAAMATFDKPIHF